MIIDERRRLEIVGDKEATTKFCVDHWVSAAKGAIDDHDAFYVALSGGSTPKVIFESLKNLSLPWEKIHLFWSDERSVPPDDPSSNYKMAMDAGLKGRVPDSQIHRMCAEGDIEQGAIDYERAIKTTLAGRPFDLVMLGMGDDGHTASLFPGTAALQEKNRLVVANHVPQKETHRMTMTFPCINSALNIAIYVLGASKEEMLPRVLSCDDLALPASHVGTKERPALWIADQSAANKL